MGTTLRNRIFILAIILFVVLLVSCSQTNKNTSLVVTNEISPSITPSETWTPQPSRSSNPSATATSWRVASEAIFATNLAIRDVTETAGYTTLAAKNAICDDGYHLFPEAFPEEILRTDVFSTNSDETWIVIQCLPEKSNQAKAYTKVVNWNGSKIWKISYDSLNLPYPDGFLIAITIDPNNYYLYLVPGCDCTVDPGRNPTWFFGGRGPNPLYRLDLSSGELTIILPYREDGYYSGPSISNDTHHLAYSDSKDSNIVFIQDLTNGEVKAIELSNDYVITGDFTWTPDGKYLIFAAGIHGWENGKAGISLFRLNLNTMYLQPLLLNDHRDFVPWFNSDSYKIWLDSNTLNLASFKVQDGAFTDFTSNEWAININTGQVILLSTPTPTP